MTRPDAGEAFDWLFDRQRFGVRPGLERMRRLVAAVGHPERRFRSLLVGGTNGKGSTATVLACALREHGERVGLYTSPHLQRLRERVRIDGRPVDDGALAAALGRVRPAVEAEDATFFEALTAAALLLFAEAGVRRAVLEVGLGGRFDATNVVEPELSLVTGVALDHVAVLGGSVREIAHEKAGIFRRGVPAWTAAEGEALRWLTAEAVERGAPLRALARDARVRVRDLGWHGLDVAVELPDGVVRATARLVGVHQARNVALGLAAARELGVPVDAARRGAERARWPGRLERLAYGPGWLVLDGAHNPEAAAALAEAVAALEGRVAVVVLGVSADKDVAGVVARLAPLGERVIVTRATSSPRAADPAALARLAGAATVASDPARALELATSWAGAGGTVLVAGSLFLVGEVRSLALDEPAEGRARWQ